MAKLQSIKRTNGSTVFSVNIPIEIIESENLEKGDEFDIYVNKMHDIILCKN